MRKAQPRRWASVALALALGVISASCFSVPIEYTAPKAVLDPYAGTVTEIVGLLDQGKGDDAKALLDDLHEAVIEARALLAGTHFSGNSGMLTDPFALPAGTYRVHLLSAGFVAVKAMPVATPQEYARLFNLGAGEATEGASTLYTSAGERIMLEFSNITAPYELWFEEIK